MNYHNYVRKFNWNNYTLRYWKIYKRVLFHLHKNTNLENNTEGFINVLYFLLYLIYIFYNFYPKLVLHFFKKVIKNSVQDLPLNTSVQTCRINCSEKSLPCIKLLGIITWTYQVKSTENMKTMKESRIHTGFPSNPGGPWGPVSPGCPWGPIGPIRPSIPDSPFGPMAPLIPGSPFSPF